jgi:hypothetical protein
MNKRTSQTILFATITVFAALTGGIAAAQSSNSLATDQPEFAKITYQPEDQAVGFGSNVTFTVNADIADSYQWLHNGVIMDGQTNSTLTLGNVGIEDVGYYSCFVTKGTEAVPTRAASLNVVTAMAGDQITVYGAPVLGGGSSGSCPGTYAGYVNYTKTVAQGWGWVPSTNTTVHTASDGAGRTDTKVLYVGRSGDNGCDQTTVAIPDPPPSTKYRFAIYFTNSVPTNAYPITLTGFNP